MYTQSLVDIAVATSTAVATTVAFYNINVTAGKILIPHLVWMGFLTLWNYSTYKRNSGQNADEVKAK